jgi:hypothetical protein
MRTDFLLAGTVAGAVVMAVLAGPGDAQPFTAQDLLKEANKNFYTNCVVTSTRYFAILLQYPRWLPAASEGTARRYIAGCQRGSHGGVGGVSAGVDGKADSSLAPIAAPPAPPPNPAATSMILVRPQLQVLNSADTPRARICRAYADLAVAQMAMKERAGCSLPGRSWSASFDFHYDWCTQRAAPLAAQNETNQRSEALRSCILRW